MRRSKTGLVQLKTLALPLLAKAPGTTGRAAAAQPPSTDAALNTTADRLALGRALRSVQPLVATERATHRRRDAADPQQLAARRAAAVGGDTTRPDAGLSDGDSSHLLIEHGTAFVRAGVAPDTPKKLRRGHWRLDAELDLHGLTLDLARQALSRFIVDCVAQDIRCIRVVHGKGFGSGQGPVLKEKSRFWLAQTEAVLAFAQTAQTEGGAGAVIVLLRNRRKTSL